jgi:hypothetical protein
MIATLILTVVAVGGIVVTCAFLWWMAPSPRAPDE